MLLAIELKYLPAGGELAAIVNIQNLIRVYPRKVVFFRSGSNILYYIDILSWYYKPLQYLLLFPYSTLG
jgi:hypothetical protein